MPLPERYAQEVPEMQRIWSPEGSFKAQTRIWIAQSEARNELFGSPTTDELEAIRGAMVLSPEDISELSVPKGHETNKLLRKVQDRLSAKVGNFIHKGNTSSDVLDTSLSLQILESLHVVEEDFTDLSASLWDLASEHRDTLQIGRSHGQHAVPQTFGRQVLGWYAEVRRGLERSQRAKEVIAYGKCSGEVGTNVFIEPIIEDLTMKKLGLKPDSAPTQVISRDRHAEVLSLMAINGGTLNRIALNIRLLSATDTGEVREPFADDQQGSSAMPHKRNSELTERVSGLSGRIKSAAGEEVDASSLWLERDISHSSTERFSFPDAFGCLNYATRLMQKVVDGLEVFPERMLENLNSTYGAIYSPRLLNALLEKSDWSRTEAYSLVQRLAKMAMDEKLQLSSLALGDEKIKSVLSTEEILELLNPEFYLRNIQVAFDRVQGSEI